jgi:hypothetical protein
MSLRLDNEVLFFTQHDIFCGELAVEPFKEIFTLKRILLTFVIVLPQGTQRSIHLCSEFEGKSLLLLCYSSSLVLGFRRA